jgi:hypothetical protein
MGVVDNREEYSPRPTSEGILALVSSAGHDFAYWTLTKSGDFYTLVSLPEDHRDEDRALRTVWFNTRMSRAAEALVHCVNLYKALGVEPNAHVEMAVRYGGLRGRTLTASSTELSYLAPGSKNLYEDEISVPALTFKLSVVETEIVDLVRKLCAPLFVVFDFASLTNDIYQQIVTDFVRRKPT